MTDVTASTTEDGDSALQMLDTEWTDVGVDRSGTTFGGRMSRMRYAAGKLATSLLAPRLSRTTFAARGFPGRLCDAAGELEIIPQTVVCGFEWSLEETDLWSLGQRLRVVDAHLRGFAVEGAAMGLSLADAIAPSRHGRRVTALLEDVGRDYVLLSLIGVGFAMNHVPRALWPRMLPDLRDHPYVPIADWLAVDGYGFDLAYFQTDKYVDRQTRPRPYPLSLFGSRIIQNKQERVDQLAEPPAPVAGRLLDNPRARLDVGLSRNKQERVDQLAEPPAPVAGRLLDNPPGHDDSDYFLRAVDQGIGRALWFICGGNPASVIAAVKRFAGSRRPDLWSGVGLAATFAGPAVDQDLHAICRAAGDNAGHVRQGSAFAARARVDGTHVPAHSHRAAQALTGKSIDALAALVHDSLRTGGPHAENWEALRSRVRSRM